MSGPAGAAPDLTRTTLAVLFIVGALAAVLWVLRPFLVPAVWATMIVVATWPLMVRVQARLGNRRALAVVVMTAGMLLVYIVPVAFSVATLLDNAGRIAEWADRLIAGPLPGPPEAIRGVPLVGPRIALGWEHLAAASADDLAARFGPQARAMVLWLVASLGSFGLMTLQFLLTTVIAAVLYAKGETAALAVRRFGQRLAGARGARSVDLAGQTIRSVALGVVLTALIQAALGGAGLAVAGVPFAVVLTGVMFVLSIAQLGPLAVLLPAVIWLYWLGSTGWGTALLVWTVLVTPLDNILRPMLIRKGLELPLILIFAGVIGGLVAFGLVGVFVGPVILAVSHTLLQAWMADGGAE